MKPVPPEQLERLTFYRIHKNTDEDGSRDYIGRFNRKNNIYGDVVVRYMFTHLQEPVPDAPKINGMVKHIRRIPYESMNFDSAHYTFFETATNTWKNKIISSIIKSGTKREIDPTKGITYFGRKSKRLSKKSSKSKRKRT